MPAKRPVSRPAVPDPGAPATAPTVARPDTGTVRRARKINRVLAETYPDARCELDFANPFELLVVTVLSAQTTDKRVNAVRPALFAAYPDAVAMAGADRDHLEELIKPTGFFRAKTESVLKLSPALVERYDGQVPPSLKELVTLPGVGRKTANVVLGNAYGIASGVVVDTHVSRVSQRLKLTAHEQPEKIERDLIELVPRTDWIIFPHLLIAHGRAVCKARTPLCAECPVERLCPSSLLKMMNAE